MMVMSTLVFITNTAGTAGRAPWPWSSSGLCVPAVLGQPEHPVPDQLSWRGEGAAAVAVGCSAPPRSGEGKAWPSAVDFCDTLTTPRSLRVPRETVHGFLLPEPPVIFML